MSSFSFCQSVLSLMLFVLFPFSISSQVFINRNVPISNAEVFGISKEITGGIFSSKFGGMYVETKFSSEGKPFYGYAMDGAVKSYTYFDGVDSGLHFYNVGDKMSIWRDSMQWRINTDHRLFYNGFKLEFGDNGNTYVGKGVTPSTSDNNIANTVLGWLSARSLDSGVSNTILGFRNAEELTTGDYNTVVGSQAANKLNGGSRNTYIGYRSGWNAGGGNSGNVFIGYRVGEGQAVNNKLMIGNSESVLPLVEGNFAAPEMKVNGDTRITGEAQIDGLTIMKDNANVLGNLGVAGNTQTLNTTLTGTNPFLDFKPAGNSRFYIQYEQTDDELNIHKPGLGAVLKIKGDGKIYIPELATSEQSRIEIKPDGELVLKTYPTVYEYTRLEEINYPFGGSSDYNVIPASDLRNGDKLLQMSIRSIWGSTIVSNPTRIYLARFNKFSGGQELLAVVTNLGTGQYNQEFNVNLNNHEVDLTNWVYYIYIHEDSAYTYVRLRRNP